MQPSSKINTILAITMLVLALPAGAIMISANALPGDNVYPIKITLEKIATLLFSPSFQARSDLEIKLIERRISENQNLLLSSGSTKGLELLVAQAESAKEYILKSHASPETKTQSVQKLVNALQQSKQALEKEKDAIATTHPPSPTNTASSYKTPNPTPIANSTISNGNSFSTPTPTSNPTPTQNPIDDISETQGQIDEIINQLETTNTLTTPTQAPVVYDAIPDPTPTSAPTPLPESNQKNRDSKSENKGQNSAIESIQETTEPTPTITTEPTPDIIQENDGQNVDDSSNYN